ncbi:hypothetical protein ACSBR2_000346 [Camellia fascicularis]
MATSVNNIAATFATVPITSSSSSPSSTNYSSNQTAFAHPISPKPISISWNPHSSLPPSHKSSLLHLYGPPGPPPPLSAAHRHLRKINHHHLPPPTSLLPKLTFSFLDRNHKLQTTNLSILSKSKRLLLVGVSAAFSPICARFVKSVVDSAKSKLADLIACVAVNNVFVMKAWGEDLAVGENVMMLSDGAGDLARALRVPLDSSGGDCLGLGVRSRRFWLSALNGVVTSLSVDFSDDDDVISPEMIGDVRILC